MLSGNSCQPIDPRKNVVSENKLLSPESRDFVAKVARECQEGNAADIGARSSDAVANPLTSPLPPGPFYGVVAFALGRFFLQRASMQPNEAEDRRTEALFRAAMNQNAFAVLRDIVTSRSFVNDEQNKAVYLGVLDELITTYMSLNAMHIRHTKNAEEVRL